MTTRTQITSAHPIDTDDVSSNPSTTMHMSEVIRAHLSRRGVLAGGATLAGAFVVGSLAGQAAASGPAGVDAGKPDKPGKQPSSKLGFTGIAPSVEDVVRVPNGYTAVPFLPWGTPMCGTYPGFKPGVNTAEEQAQQMGMNHDGMHFFPLDEQSRRVEQPLTGKPGRDSKGSDHGVLVVNHEYTEENWLHSATGASIPLASYTMEMVKRSQAAHGVSITEVRRTKGKLSRKRGDTADTPLGTWQVVKSPLNRRITANTPMTFSGPAAGHALLRTPADPHGRSPIGTMNNCSMGYTPWGTYLTCEENFNNYFAKTDGTYSVAEEALLKRYGISAKETIWSKDPRFTVKPGESNESNRFGWCVEIDPCAPMSTPVKRTALGRVKHEGATVWEAADGRVVVYTGDDQVNEYIYKYVSARPWREMRKEGKSPLDDGTLYVARFNADGSGQWLPLVHGQGKLTSEGGFADQGEVVVRTRFAADAVGATPMDRPEWCTVDPTSGRVYFTLTNNKDRKVADAANPRNPNPWGHIISWDEAGNDHGATTFTWSIYVLAGPGDGAEGSTVGADAAFGSPDGLRADVSGRLWIQTDGAQPGKVNNQMMCADPTAKNAKGQPDVRRFLTGVVGCEITGITFTPDHRTMFVGVQHPGEDGKPSTWPQGLGTTMPRAALVVVTKDDGGVIGT